MKGLFLFLSLFVSALYVRAITTITLKVGETYTISGVASASFINFTTSGNAIATEYYSVGNNFSVSVKVTAVAPGYGSVNFAEKNKGYVFHVIGVSDIDIPANLSLTVGDNYTYSPIIKESEATTTFTWVSSDTSVATINSNGSLTAVGTGITTITCKAANGVRAQSVVSVSPKIVQSVSVNHQSSDLSVGDNLQLTSSVLPANATNKNVKWFSSNENVALVDDAGNVTAVGTGYCSIYAKADDGSGKFDRCLIHVDGPIALKGDINGDGKVSVTDAVSVIDMILNNQ